MKLFSFKIVSHLYLQNHKIFIVMAIFKNELLNHKTIKRQISNAFGKNLIFLKFSSVHLFFITDRKKGLFLNFLSIK